MIGGEIKNNIFTKKLKMVRHFIIILVLCCWFNPLRLTGQQAGSIESVFGNKNEIYFRFKVKTPAEIEQLTNIISIDKTAGAGWVYAYANKAGFEKFLALETGFELLPHPGSLINPLLKSFDEMKETDEWDFYPTYEAYVEMMYEFENKYPGLCDVFSIGTSVEGRQLLIAKLSANVGVQENEPRFLYTSSIHGDETTGYILMLRLIDHLLKSFNSNDQITHLLKNMEIWINPLANPDGTYAGGNNSLYGATRFNANNIDLNRNYPDFQDGPHPDGNDWQKETIEFMELADSVSFIMSANFHGGAEVFNYPWDTWATLHADDDWWKLVGREWADTVHKHAPAGYFDDEDNGITNGYAWYTLNGGRQDYMNYYHHCREVTLEISNTKLLPESLLNDFWEYNYRSFLNYMNQALYGIAGTITDSQTGLPLKATVTIEDHDKDGSYVVSDSVTGGYFRPVAAGTYTITYSAPKYASKTIEQVKVVDYEQTLQDVSLVYTGAGVGDALYSNQFIIAAKSIDNTLTINYSGNDSHQTVITLCDLSGRVKLRDEFKFGADNKTFAFPISEMANGVYIVNLTSDKFFISTKILNQ